MDNALDNIFQGENVEVITDNEVQDNTNNGVIPIDQIMNTGVQNQEPVNSVPSQEPIVIGQFQEPVNVVPTPEPVAQNQEVVAETPNVNEVVVEQEIPKTKKKDKILIIQITLLIIWVVLTALVYFFGYDLFAPFIKVD